MTFLDEIYDDIQWRMAELGSLKSIPLRYNLMEHHKNILIKYSIPSMYSIWEGYVKNTFELYIREINKLRILINETHINVLTHALSSFDKLCLENPRVSFIKKREFIEFYQDKINQPLSLVNKIPTKSNIDFSVINDILVRFNLEILPERFEKQLKKFLRFRNNIAHGDLSIPVNLNDINFFSALVSDLMVEIFNRIDNGYNQQTFKI